MLTYADVMHISEYHVCAHGTANEMLLPLHLSFCYHDVDWSGMPDIPSPVFERSATRKVPRYLNDQLVTVEKTLDVAVVVLRDVVIEGSRAAYT
jgi:hypothetical protein